MSSHILLVSRLSVGRFRSYTKKELAEYKRGFMQEAYTKIEAGDILYAVSAVKVFGARYERKLIPAIDLNFDTIMGAIGSNEPKWQCRDVALQFMRPSEADEEAVREFLKFFEIPPNNVWRTG